MNKARKVIEFYTLTNALKNTIRKAIATKTRILETSFLFFILFSNFTFTNHPFRFFRKYHIN